MFSGYLNKTKRQIKFEDGCDQMKNGRIMAKFRNVRSDFKHFSLKTSCNLKTVGDINFAKNMLFSYFLVRNPVVVSKLPYS